ncbi:MAG: peptidoglycan DD-metalloendopeptidase family protein [Ilyomonas sp.]
MDALTVDDILQKYRNCFYKIVPFDPERDKLLLMDFTSANNDLNGEILNDTEYFSQYINHQLKTHHATYGIGGYNEKRTIYSRSNVFDAANNAEEPRRLHLGVDIWGKEGTEIYAPLDAIVHSFAYNSAYGDYGATIILQHQIKQLSFYTLYGHLSLKDIKDLYEGQPVYAGKVIAHFGNEKENGNWPPHLHFQLIKNMEGRRGDYPGVCRLSERDMYLKNCPDPDLILNMMQYAQKTQ